MEWDPLAGIYWGWDSVIPCIQGQTSVQICIASKATTQVSSQYSLFRLTSYSRALDKDLYIELLCGALQDAEVIMLLFSSCLEPL